MRNYLQDLFIAAIVNSFQWAQVVVFFHKFERPVSWMGNEITRAKSFGVDIQEPRFLEGSIAVMFRGGGGMSSSLPLS